MPAATCLVSLFLDAILQPLTETISSKRHAGLCCVPEAHSLSFILLGKRNDIFLFCSVCIAVPGAFNAVTHLSDLCIAVPAAFNAVTHQSELQVNALSDVGAGYWVPVLWTEDSRLRESVSRTVMEVGRFFHGRQAACRTACWTTHQMKSGFSPSDRGCA